MQSARGLGTWLRGPVVRYVILLLLDGAVAVGALWLALAIRFEGNIRPQYLLLLPTFLLLLVASRLLSNLLFQLHRWSFRFSGLPDAMRVVLAGLLGTGLFVSALFLGRVEGPPRSVVVLEFFLSTAGMGMLRFTPRLAWLYMADRTRARRNGVTRTLILGAGAAGELLLRDLQRSEDHSYYVVGFVDDDPNKVGTILGGKPVLGRTEDLPRLARQLGVSKVLIAIPRLPAKRIREILSLCAESKLRFKMLPVSFVYVRDHAPLTMLKDLQPEDLLQRDEVDLSNSALTALLPGRTVLVTGAAGSIGSEICRQLLGAGVSSLVMVDINENGLYLLQRGFERTHPDARVIAHVADIRDMGSMKALFERYRPNDVFHAAAHKHVPLLEEAPAEGVKNNVFGTLNVALAAVAVGVERFVFISTDKAVRPASVMGATKRVGEMIVRSLAQRSKTRFCAVRFGNVLGSAGSVVPLFCEQIAAGGPVTVTHPEVRRYFMTISEAVGLVLTSAYSDYGELCVLEMGEPIRILDLARHLITMAGKVPDVEIPLVFTGLRPGEKLTEELTGEEEECAVRVHPKVLVVESPPPPPDLEAKLQKLLAAAQDGDGEGVRKCLRELVPSYQPAQSMPRAPREETYVASI